MKIVFRADASTRMGTGHIMRCLTLAQAFQSDGHDVSFICKKIKGDLIEFVQSKGFAVNVVEHGSGRALRFFDEDNQGSKLDHADWLGGSQIDDAVSCKVILDRIKPDWLIVDHYSLDYRWQILLKPYYRKLMVIDDLGDRNHICDVLLDQNYGADAYKYLNKVPENCILLTGSKYSLLRPEFSEWRSLSLKRRHSKQVIKKVIITMGGMDPDNFTGKILEQLKECDLPHDVKFVAVLGSQAPNINLVERQSKEMTLPVSVKTGVENMAELMASCDFAIGAAGSTTWERCCLGLPTIQMVIAENQRPIAQALVNKGAAKMADDISRIPSLLASANSWIIPVSQSCREITDGKGCEKVVTRLKELQ